MGRIGRIDVDGTGLAWLGASCEQRADAIAKQSAPAVNGGFAATTAAVRALHDDADAAAGRIAERVRSTGQRVAAAGSQFAATETDSSDLVRSATVIA
ncbi:hypothetical protein CQY20_33365 [Mycolicibacterium agri]|uniref:ESX-1 secretion-associated protein n=1 Tax=Mycolicibacterium agri TaxID=36811 RepID=A0A2A7MNQ4_MYCAG|nr:hypothetical protein [Mycolicibacterium agri]PEG32971.1 hypothetical protein CQY20_33365 [Mycolicibacterium agri]GFG51054.1 hypothetical protein MAGR_24950 [Mycolicibacterium agri]